MLVNSWDEHLFCFDTATLFINNNIPVDRHVIGWIAIPFIWKNYALKSLRTVQVKTNPESAKPKNYYFFLDCYAKKWGEKKS